MDQIYPMKSQVDIYIDDPIACLTKAMYIIAAASFIGFYSSSVFNYDFGSCLKRRPRNPPSKPNLELDAEKNFDGYDNIIEVCTCVCVLWVPMLFEPIFFGE